MVQDTSDSVKMTGFYAAINASGCGLGETVEILTRCQFDEVAF